MHTRLLSPRSPTTIRNFALLMLGLAIFGLGISFLRRAGLGLDPWSALHEGLSRVLGVSFGTASVAAGVVILGVGVRVFGQRVDWGTLMNMLLIGPWVDLFYPFVPEAGDWGPAARWAWLLLGIGLVGFGSGMYISSRWGAGPRDGFVLAAAARTGLSVRVLRGGLELSVLGIGVLLGAQAGAGTVAFALLVGPSMQLGLRLFGVLPGVGTNRGRAA